MYMSDASQGVNIRKELDDQLEKSVAFPCSIALASTWNKELTVTYAKSIGEECRAGEIAVLLGPGINYIVYHRTVETLNTLAKIHT